MDFLNTLRHDFHFPGHILPGTAFIIMGIWWMVNTFRIFSNTSSSSSHHSTDEESQTFLHYNSRDCNFNKNSKGSESNTSLQYYTATFNSNSNTLGIFGCEGFFKLLYASFDLFCHILVVITGGSFVDEAQHMTIYIFFIINALVDIVVFIGNNYTASCNIKKSNYQLPEGIDFIVGGFTWIGFGFLFLSHKHHKNEIQIYYHTILAWITICVGITYLIQWKYQNNMIVSILRSFCSILVGSWLYQIAFMFHNPFKISTQIQNGNLLLAVNHERGGENVNAFSHSQLMMSQHEIIMDTMFGATIFTWHVIIVFILTCILGFIILKKKPNVYDYIAIPNC